LSSGVDNQAAPLVPINPCGISLVALFLGHHSS